jgi:hypothetical protein
MQANVGVQPGAARRAPREWTADDDALLGAILSLREAWRECRGRVTLATLELDPHLVTLMISGLCPKHGQFVREWSGRLSDPLPLEARCPVGESGRCSETSPVFVLV